MRLPGSMQIMPDMQKRYINKRKERSGINAAGRMNYER